MKLSDADKEMLSRFFGSSFHEDFELGNRWTDAPNSAGVVTFVARNYGLGDLFLLFGALEHLQDARLEETALHDLIFGDFGAFFDPTMPDKHGERANATLQDWVEDLVRLLREGISARAEALH